MSSPTTTGWALDKGRLAVRAGLPLTYTLVLIGYAELAEQLLRDGNRYEGSTPGQVAYLLGVSESTVLRYTREAIRTAVLVASRVPGNYRLSEEAFNR